MNFVLKMQCKKAIAKDGSKLTNEGLWVWVCNDSWGPTCELDSTIPVHVKVFKNLQDAEEFSKTFAGHPWYYQSNGIWKFVEVIPKMVHRGWVELNETP